MTLALSFGSLPAAYHCPTGIKEVLNLVQFLLPFKDSMGRGFSFPERILAQDAWLPVLSWALGSGTFPTLIMN